VSLSLDVSSQGKADSTKELSTATPFGQELHLCMNQPPEAAHLQEFKEQVTEEDNSD
jgi:hypothetical protein